MQIRFGLIPFALLLDHKLVMTVVVWYKVKLLRALITVISEENLIFCYSDCNASNLGVESFALDKRATCISSFISQQEGISVSLGCTTFLIKSIEYEYYMNG